MSTAITYYVAPTGTSSSQGESETARFIIQEGLEYLSRLHRSRSFGMWEAFGELFEVMGECRTANWDGYGANPVTPGTYQHARRLLQALLPLGVAVPSIDAEPDGFICLEWHKSPRHTFSLSVSPDGYLHYAALFGPSKAFGTEPFFGEIPVNILKLIRQV